MSNDTDGLEESLAWIADLFDEPVERISPETLRENISNWDSLGVLTLMAELDEKFQVTVSDRDIQAMTKVDDILRCLRVNGKLCS